MQLKKRARDQVINFPSILYEDERALLGLIVHKVSFGIYLTESC